MRSRLSEREKEILRLLAEGFDQEAIAARLEVNPSAVRADLRDIFSKVVV